MSGLSFFSIIGFVNGRLTGKLAAFILQDLCILFFFGSPGLPVSDSCFGFCPRAFWYHLFYCGVDGLNTLHPPSAMITISICKQ